MWTHYRPDDSSDVAFVPETVCLDIGIGQSSLKLLYCFLRTKIRHCAFLQVPAKKVKGKLNLFHLGISNRHAANVWVDFKTVVIFNLTVCSCIRVLIIFIINNPNCQSDIIINIKWSDRKLFDSFQIEIMDK